MRKVAWLMLAICAMTWPAHSHAQEASSQQARSMENYLTPEMIEELEWWYKEMVKWQRWAVTYFNRALTVNQHLIEIHSPPETPVWMVELCPMANLDEVSHSKIQEACKLLKQIGPVRNITALMSELPKHRELPFITKFLERLHIDSGYLDSRYRKSRSDSFQLVRTYGYFGIHYTPIQLGRVQIFGPPGILLGRNDLGKPELMYTWGFSIEVVEFRMPVTNFATLGHINIVRAWHIGRNEALESRWNYKDLVGMSFTWRVRR